MKQILEKLKQLEVLDESDINSIEESFEQQKEEFLNAERAKIEESIRQEFAEKYRVDRDSLIAASEEMISSALNEHFAQNESRINELSELKNTLETEAINYQKSLAEKFSKDAKASEVFVESILNNHIKDFQADIDLLEELKIKAARAIHEAQDHYKELFLKEQKNLRNFTISKLKEQYDLLNNKSKHMDNIRDRLIENAREANNKRNLEIKEHMAALDKEVSKRLFESIRDLEDEKRQVANTRVQMVTEARERMLKNEQDLAKRFAEQADYLVTKELVQHINEIKQDITEAKQNTFGSKIFEAYMSEFLGSHFSDGTRTKNLLESIRTKDEQISLLESKLKEVNKSLLKESQQKQRIQDNAERQQVLNSLLSTLTGNKRETMRTMLESVDTSKLKDKFKFYLTQMNETISTNAKKPQTLIENTILTGNKENVKTVEDIEHARILKLAGLN